MLDYKRTEQLFKAEITDEELFKKFYKKPQGQLDDELFLAKVMRPETNTFYQPSDLPEG